MKRTDFESLTLRRNFPCISIYMPTHRKGEEVLKGEDRLVLKNLLNDIKLELGDLEYSNKDIQHLLTPAEELLKDSMEWKFKSEGLAIFIADQFYRRYELPLKFEPYTSVSQTFYITPLIPFFMDNGTFYLLSIEINRVRFLKADRYNMEEQFLDEDLPARLEEAVGYDQEQKNLQYRTQQRGKMAKMFHGHGEGKEDRKDEITRFFRDIDKGLMKLLHDKDAPLVVACLDDQFPLYREINSYPYLMAQHLDCHPSDLSTEQLHQKAWEMVRPHFDRIKGVKLEQFTSFRDTGKTAVQVTEIVPMALKGRVDTLFVEEGSDIWGNYDAKTYHTTFSSKKEAPAISLTNMMAVNTFLKGGHVFLMDKGEMPVPNAKICALLRY